MNLSLWAQSYYQVVAAIGLVIAFYLVISHVLETTISDKYGIGWTVFAGILFFLNLKYLWTSFVSSETAGLIVSGTLCAIYLGISLSIQLTEYSRARRKAIQDVALLRFRYEKLLSKMETSEENKNTLQQIR